MRDGTSCWTVGPYDAPPLVAAYRRQALQEGGFARLKTRHLHIRPVSLSGERRIASLTWLFCLALHRQLDLDLPVVLPRFHQVLIDEGYLAIVGHDAVPDPWSILGDVVQRYRTDGGYQPYDMIADLVQRGLFQKVGERHTAPIQFVQSIDDYIESYHSRSGFSRERMGPARAAAFDEEARTILRALYPKGSNSLQVVGSVVWGLPRG